MSTEVHIFLVWLIVQHQQWTTSKMTTPTRLLSDMMEIIAEKKRNTIDWGYNKAFSFYVNFDPNSDVQYRTTWLREREGKHFFPLTIQYLICLEVYFGQWLLSTIYLLFHLLVLFSFNYTLKLAWRCIRMARVLYRVHIWKLKNGK